MRVMTIRIDRLTSATRNQRRHVRHFLYSLFLIATFFFWSVDKLEAGDDGDFRSQCRLAVGGLLVSTTSEIDRAQAIINAWNKKSAHLQTELSKWHEQKKALEGKIKQLPFDRKLEEELLGLDYKINLAESEWKQGKAIAAQEMKILEKSTAFRKVFRARIIKIFDIKKASLMEKSGYDFKVTFRHTCGKYQYVCPLPAEQRRFLNALADEFPNLAACKKYASIRPPE